MSERAILLSVVKVAAGGSGEELILRIPRGYAETVWHRIVARNASDDATRVEIWVRIGTGEYLLRAAAQAEAGRTIHVDTSVTVPDDAMFVAKFFDADAGEVLGLWAFGREFREGIGN